MNKRYINICLVALFLVGIGEVSGQNHILRYAEKQYELGNYRHASEEYERAFEKRGVYSTARHIAESYREMQDYPSSYSWWSKVVSFEESEREDYLEYLRSGYLQKGSELDVNGLLSGSGYSQADFPEIDFA